MSSKATRLSSPLLDPHSQRDRDTRTGGTRYRSLAYSLIQGPKSHPQVGVARQRFGAALWPRCPNLWGIKNQIVLLIFLLLILTFSDVPLIVFRLHLDPTAQTQGLQGGDAGLGAEVIVAYENAHLHTKDFQKIKLFLITIFHLKRHPGILFT